MIVVVRRVSQPPAEMRAWLDNRDLERLSAGPDKLDSRADAGKSPANDSHTQVLRSLRFHSDWFRFGRDRHGWLERCRMNPVVDGDVTYFGGESERGDGHSLRSRQ